MYVPKAGSNSGLLDPAARTWIALARWPRSGATEYLASSALTPASTSMVPASAAAVLAVASGEKADTAEQFFKGRIRTKAVPFGVDFQVNRSRKATIAGPLERWQSLAVLPEGG